MDFFDMLKEKNTVEINFSNSESSEFINSIQKCCPDCGSNYCPKCCGCGPVGPAPE